MKLVSALIGTALSQVCGPTAEYGGAFWPGQSPDQPCGIHYTDNSVTAGQTCVLSITDPTAVPYFLTLGGVFVTSQMMPGVQEYHFHTYDNWAGNYNGVDVTIFWTNPDADIVDAYGVHGTTGCFNADQVCITCNPAPDTNGDGIAGPVSGVYLGNFMHDFRHAEYSCVNVPIANDQGHVAGTTYTVSLFDDQGNPVPVDQIQSHYGHQISPSTTAANGQFTVHVGCEDFNGQFYYVSFCHTTDVESSGWFSAVTTANEGTAGCPPPANTPAQGSQGTQQQGAYGGNTGGNTNTGGNMGSSYGGNTQQNNGYNGNQGSSYGGNNGSTKGNKNKNKNKNNKNRNYEYDNSYDNYNGTNYDQNYEGYNYDGNYDGYNYRK